MKTLQNHTLLYDKDCPMCNLYSKAFINCGMLDKEGRENFSEMSAQNELIIDYNRAKNEIALINHDKNEVAYGLDSLLVIIGNSFPTLEKIGRLKPVYWFFKKLYSLVTYNRKIIVPSGKLITEKSCVPSFNLKYRLFYIFVALLFSSVIFSHYFSRILPIKGNFEFLLVAFLITLSFEIIILGFFSKRKLFDYLGNFATVILSGALFLLPLLLFKLDATFCFYYLMVNLIFMSVELFRRWLLLLK